MTHALTKICDLFDSARERVLIVSAYVGSKTLDTLLSASSPNIHRAIYARWAQEDISSGASEWEAWDVAMSHGVPIFACPKLHAKVYIADNVALVGSANATWNGLEAGNQGNLELLIEVSSDIQEIQDSIAAIQTMSQLALPFGSDMACQNNDDLLVDSESSTSIWTPRSNPKFFLRAMCGEDDHSEASIKDRDALDIREKSFNQELLRKALKNQTVFRVIDYVFRARLKPMYQNELRETLSQRVSSRFSQLSSNELTNLAQWLGQFGENIHLSPTSEGKLPSLIPGRFLISEREFID